MSLKASWEWIKSIFRVILYISKGVSNLPDYEAYVRHLEKNHPGQTPPTEKEFFTDFLTNKYGANAKRC